MAAAAASGGYLPYMGEGEARPGSDSSEVSSSSDEEGTGDPQSWRQGRGPTKIDVSYQSLDSEGFDRALQSYEPFSNKVQKLFAENNALTSIPPSANLLINLTSLDMSNNLMSVLPEDAFAGFRCLAKLSLRNNLLRDEGMPKSLGGDNLAHTLRELNLSGNMLTQVPPCILSLRGMKNLFLGGNALTNLPPEIGQLDKLRVLYVGGNMLKSLPDEIGQLKSLRALVLADNQLASLPNSICRLSRLAYLQLHLNRLTTLPHGLVSLEGLTELSLRGNPLVVRFVREMNFEPSSLMEISAQAVKSYQVPYDAELLPRVLVHYLDCAHSCLNPKCRGVYFDTKVEHVKFVDFCGKYRVPLLQYLCSSRCSPENPAFTDHRDLYSRALSSGAAVSEADADEAENAYGVDDVKFKKVLLG